MGSVSQLLSWVAILLLALASVAEGVRVKGLRGVDPQGRHSSSQVEWQEMAAESEFDGKIQLPTDAPKPPRPLPPPQLEEVVLMVNATVKGQQIPSTLLGIFFEEINHAGAGGLDAELVVNRGFEAGGHRLPSTISPWLPWGAEADVSLATELSSPFPANPVALRVSVSKTAKEPVGVLNQGYWGMNFERGKKYEVSYWVRSLQDRTIVARLASFSGHTVLAHQDIKITGSEASAWQKQQFQVTANDTDHQGILQVLSSEPGTFWIDQVSVMPVETFKGHGLRTALVEMLSALNPGFMRFPGGCYVEGKRLANAFRWRETVGPRDQRPGHYNDVWGYWSDDNLGLFEYFQLCEDIDTEPVWVFNSGISHSDEVPTSVIEPFVEDILNGIEFVRGPASSQWGGVRASMGHPEPFKLSYIAIGNEDCWGQPYYKGNYLRFYQAIKEKYPDINLISNCDGSLGPLPHPAELFDYHIYAGADDLFHSDDKFDKMPRQNGPKAFVSEYAVVGPDSGRRGTLKGALAEAAFMMGLERNSDVIGMASYAPLFVNDHDRRWSPDAIVFDSWRQFGSPSFHVQEMFAHTRGSALLPSRLQGSSVPLASVRATALRRKCQKTGREIITLKVVNYGKEDLHLTPILDGVDFGASEASGPSSLRVLTSADLMDENDFERPDKVAPKTTKLQFSKHTKLVLLRHSFVVIDIPV